MGKSGIGILGCGIGERRDTKSIEVVFGILNFDVGLGVFEKIFVLVSRMF